MAQSGPCSRNLWRWLLPGYKATKRIKYSWVRKGPFLAFVLFSRWKEVVYSWGSWRSKFLPQTSFANNEDAEGRYELGSISIISSKNHHVVWVWGPPQSKPMELWPAEEETDWLSEKAGRLLGGRKLPPLLHKRHQSIWVCFTTKVLWVSFQSASIYRGAFWREVPNIGKQSFLFWEVDVIKKALAYRIPL